MSESVPRILLVLDSQAADWTPPEITGWTVHTVVRKGTELRTLVGEGDKHVCAETSLVIILGLHCNLTYLTSYSSWFPQRSCAPY